METAESISTKLSNFNILECASSTDIYHKFWQDLNILRGINGNELKNWEHYESFTTTKRAHLNGNKSFDRLPWEESFVLDFVYTIKH
jgi:hypothetical protein